jgi:hypothetical protein
MLNIVNDKLVSINLITHILLNKKLFSWKIWFSTYFVILHFGRLSAFCNCLNFFLQLNNVIHISIFFFEKTWNSSSLKKPTTLHWIWLFSSILTPYNIHKWLLDGRERSGKYISNLDQILNIVLCVRQVDA